MKQSIPFIIIPKRHHDSRGWLSETFNETRMHDLGITCRFIQDNQSNTKRAGTVRGFHFQIPPAAQTKLVRVIQGRVLDVAVDVRRGSPSFGRHISVELSADNGYQLYLPEGFAHAFVSLIDDVTVAYKVSSAYSPANEGGLRWNDSDIAFPWPFNEASTTVSDRDRTLSSLNAFDSPFHYDGTPLTHLDIVNVG